MCGYGKTVSAWNSSWGCKMWGHGKIVSAWNSYLPGYFEVIRRLKQLMVEQALRHPSGG